MGIYKWLIACFSNIVEKCSGKQTNIMGNFAEETNLKITESVLREESNLIVRASQHIRLIGVQG